METLFSIQKIVLIGSGNVATQLGMSLHEAGYSIIQVYSRTRKSATLLAKKLNAEAVSDFEKISTDGTLYIIAVKDDAISELAKQLKLKEQLVVHTSGTADISILKNCSKNYGVFYPLQTFSKSKQIDFMKVPVCIEANNKKTTDQLVYFAKSISRQVRRISSEQRKMLHLAAVFACNFSNDMYVIASTILSNHRLPFDLLKPLIMETAEKVQSNDPVKMQTGPAIREDIKTITAHLNLLKDKKLKSIYKLMSDHIINNIKK